MTTATVGSRFQVVIPLPERKKLGLKPHDRVTVDVHNGCVVIQPAGAAGLRAIGRELADGADATDYVRTLRREWAGRP